MASRALAAARPPDPPEYLEALRREVQSAQWRPGQRRPRPKPRVDWIPWQPAVDKLVGPVVAVAAEHFRVTVADVLSRDRHTPVSLARALSVCLLRARYRWSFPEIANALGIDHSSAIHAFRHRWGPAEHALVFGAYQLGRHP